MYPRMSRRAVRKSTTGAADSALASRDVHYPGWYLVHWHFLPNGYLSRGSVAAYDHVLRRVYYAGQEGRVTRRLARMLSHQYPDGRFLDIGCGPGRLLRALDDAGPAAEIVGADLSPFQLERAAANTRTVLAPTRLVHADATRLPFAPAEFDAAVAGHVLGHLPSAATAQVLAEAHRVVRPGGRLFLFEHGWHKVASGPWQRVASSAIRGTFGRVITLERSA